SVDGIARAKGEIFEGLSDEGVAIVNADDVFAGLWKGIASGNKILTFGLDNPADVSATYELNAESSLLHLDTPLGRAEVRLPVAGRHNVCNALAATAAAVAMGADLDSVVAGLESFVSVKGRLQR